MSRQTISECINMGKKDTTGNGQVGGTYTPATPTSAASFSTTLAVVNPKYKDKAGKVQDGPKETIYVTVWNSKTGGAPWADIFAKYLSVGKRLKNVILDRHQYMAQAKGASGELLVKPDGTPFLIQKEGYTLIRAELGRDSSKRLDEEVHNWMIGKGELNFTSRPPFWNGCPPYMIAMGCVSLQQVNDGKNLWAQISAARAATAYQPGMTMFGYAKVIVKGAPFAQPVAAPVQQYTGNIPGFTNQAPVAPTMAGYAGATLPAAEEGAVIGEEDVAAM